MLKRVCVFSGSSADLRPEYGEAAAQVGRVLAENSMTLVYGGGSAGLPGVVAEAALGAGGRVVGVLLDGPGEKESAHPGLTELRVVASPEERRLQMAELSDGFLALPGGIGTLEEIFEIWTWGQQGFHQKPCGLLNTAEYYTHMLKSVDDLAVERFVRETQRGMLIVDRNPEALLRAMADFRPPESRRLAFRDDE